MIQANELRVGNFLEMLVVDDYETRQLKASEILSLEKHPDWAKPVILNEEILLRCGFIGDESNMNLVLPNGNATELCCEFNRDWCIVRYHVCDGVVNRMEYDYAYLTPIKHLHQLQNLFYCLTGQELTINFELLITVKLS